MKVEYTYNASRACFKISSRLRGGNEQEIALTFSGGQMNSIETATVWDESDSRYLDGLEVIFHGEWELEAFFEFMDKAKKVYDLEMATLAERTRDQLMGSDWPMDRHGDE